MKYRWDKKYLYWGVTAFFVTVFGTLFYYFLFHGSNISEFWKRLTSILMPVIDGLVLAYLLTPIVNYIERKILYPLTRRFKITVTLKIKKRLRNISIMSTMIFFFLVISTFFRLVIPQIIISIESIVDRFPTYANNLNIWVGELLENNPTLEKITTNYLEEYSTDIQGWLSGDVLPQLNSIILTLSNSILNIITFLWNLIIGLIISVYVMASKELFVAQSKKTFFALFDETKANNLLDELRYVHKTFSRYITGKLLDSLLVGLICFIFTTLIGAPYAVLISVIVGITNIIPFLGPYLGGVPCALLILMVDPKMCLYFVIFLIVMQQFDGNVLEPKILGDSTGISSFWVLFAITFFGGIFGLFGMFIGVPVFAVFYTEVKKKINKELLKKNLPDSTSAYMHLRHIHNHELQIQSDPSVSTKANEKPELKIIIKKNSSDDMKNIHDSDEKDE